MENKMDTLKRTARLAGLLYLVIVLASVYGHIYVPMQIFVAGDAAATTNNILSKEFLFRSCIVAGLIETTAFLMLAFTLHRLLKGINNQYARLMVALISVQVPLALVFAVLKFMAITVLKNNIVSSGDATNVAMMFLHTVRYGSTVLGIFSGLWLFPLGMLVLKARFIPQAMGILLLVAAAGNLLYGLMGVLFPAYSQSPLPAFVLFFLSEIPFMLWLLIKGVKEHISIAVISEKQVYSKELSEGVEI